MSSDPLDEPPCPLSTMIRSLNLLCPFTQQGVVMGPAVGKQVRRKWWWLLGEMAFGVASVAVLGGFSVSLAARALYRAVQ